MKIKPISAPALALLLAAAAALPAAAPAVAADTAASGSSQPATALPARDVRASKIIGMKVRNPQDESLGKIDDLVIDTHNERIAYAVLSFGGAMGLGTKLFAYPLAVFQPSASHGDELVLNIDKEKLKSAPGFERKNWPDFNKDSYRADLERHFGPTVSPKLMPDARLARASELIGKKVEDREGKHAGKVKDIVLNLGTSRVHYAVLDFDKAWSMNDKLLPLSMASLSFPDDPKKQLVLNVARNNLDMKHAFEERRWPDVGDPAYQREMDRYLAATPRPAGPAGPLRKENME